MELIVDKEYYLISGSGQYCHSMDKTGSSLFKEGLYKFIGTIYLGDDYGGRNIFYSSDSGTTYVMFSSECVDYIKDKNNMELLEKVNTLEKELKEIKAKLK